MSIGPSLGPSATAVEFASANEDQGFSKSKLLESMRSGLNGSEVASVNPFAPILKRLGRVAKDGLVNLNKLRSGILLERGQHG